MAFASGPVSFQRFFVDGKLERDVTDKFVAALNKRAFGKLAALPDDTQLGWIGPRHLFETEISAETIACGRFAHLALRVDRLRAPSNVLKAYVRLEEEAALTVSGREYLSKGEKRKAREAALLRAEKEARAGGFRRMSSCGVLIDLERPAVYLATLGVTTADVFTTLFRETFACPLTPADPEHVAVRLTRGSRRERTLENLPACHFASPPGGLPEESSDTFAGGMSFLGREFLTWLWYHTDAADEPLRISTGDELTVLIDRSLRLKCDFDQTGTDVITAENPTALPEARAALRIGKQPTKMGLLIGSPLGEFRLTLDAERMSVSGFVPPEDEARSDFRARLEHRFESVADAADLVDALFDLFLGQRLAREWTAQRETISTWVSGKPAGSLLQAASA